LSTIGLGAADSRALKTQRRHVHAGGTARVVVGYTAIYRHPGSAALEPGAAQSNRVNNARYVDGDEMAGMATALQKWRLTGDRAAQIG